MKLFAATLELVDERGRSIELAEQHERFDRVGDERDPLRALDSTLDREAREVLPRRGGIAQREVEESERAPGLDRVGKLADRLAELEAIGGVLARFGDLSATRLGQAEHPEDAAVEQARVDLLRDLHADTAVPQSVLPAPGEPLELGEMETQPTTGGFVALLVRAAVLAQQEWPCVVDLTLANQTEGEHRGGSHVGVDRLELLERQRPAEVRARVRGHPEDDLEVEHTGQRAHPEPFVVGRLRECQRLPAGIERFPQVVLRAHVELALEQRLGAAPVIRAGLEQRLLDERELLIGAVDLVLDEVAEQQQRIRAHRPGLDRRKRAFEQRTSSLPVTDVDQRRCGVDGPCRPRFGLLVRSQRDRVLE